MRHRRRPRTPAPRPGSPPATYAGVAPPERLESRVLLAAFPTAGHVDPTYGHLGTAAFADAGWSHGAALQPDGRLVMVGEPTDVQLEGKIPLARFNPDGSPDLSFGTGGRLMLALPRRAWAGPVLVQADGRIVVAGWLREIGPFGEKIDDSFIARLLPDGTLDPSFGNGGVFAADIRGTQQGDRITALTLDGDRIVGAYAGGPVVGVVRLTPAGRLDPSLAGDGTAEIGPVVGSVADLLVRPDGKYLMTGPVSRFSQGYHDWFFARLNADGSPDASFGTDASGMTLAGLGGPNDDPWCYRLAPAPGGGFYAAGNRDGAVLVGRFLPNGAPDLAFDGDGFATLGVESIIGGATTVGGLLSDADGRVVVAGSTHLLEPDPRPDQPHSYLARFLARFNPDGTRDATFGTDGLVDERDGTLPYRARYVDLVRQADGKFLAPANDFRATRYEDELLPPANPVAVLAGPSRAGEQDGVVFSAAGSYDLDGNVMKYEWDTDYDGSTFSPEFEGPATPPLTRLDGPSVRTVALRVTDDEGRTSIGTSTLTVDNSPPAVYFSAPRRAKEGSPYVLHLFARDAGVDAVDHWTIDWGDGSAPQTVAGDVTVVSHTYPDGPANFALRVSATDEDGTWEAADMGPDLAYGTDGTAVAAWVDGVRTLLPLEDGRVLYAGMPQSGSRAFEVYRAGADGLPDPTFTAADGAGAGRGQALPHQGVVQAIGLQGDGKVLAAGITHEPNAGFYQWTAVARYTPDGRLDPTFGTGGVVELPIDSTLSTAGAIVPLADGKILVGGMRSGRFALLRLLPDGSPDPTFGTGGKAVGPQGGAMLGDLAIAADGKIVAGTGPEFFSYDLVVARFNPDGSVDPTFGDGGSTKVAAPGSPGTYVKAGRMVLTADGRIVAAGEVPSPEMVPGALPQRSVVYRLTADGRLDPTFGDQGFAFPRPYPVGEAVAGLAVDALGRPLLGTFLYGGSDDGYALSRLTPDGAPDTTFTPTGTMRFDPAVGKDHAAAMALDAAGNVVFGGYSDFNLNRRATLVRLTPHGSHQVENVAPTVTLTGPAGAYSDAPYAVGLAYADPGADAPRSWQIDWGDGSTSDLPGTATSASHAYAAAGDYTVTARVTDEDGTYAATRVARLSPPPAVNPLNGFLTVAGTPDADAMTLAVNGGVLAVGVGARQWSFPLASVTRVVVDSGEGADTLDVAASYAASGPALVFHPGGAQDKLVVHGTAGDDLFEVGSSTVSVGGRIVATIVGVETVQVHGGAGADRLASPAGPVGVRFEGGDGDDTVDAARGSGSIDFDGGAGADAFTYRAPVSPTSFTVDPGFVRTSSGARLFHSGVETLSFYGGAGADLFYVTGTSPGVTYFLFGEGGDDRLRLASITGGGGDMGRLAGPLTFAGGAGTEEVELADGMPPNLPNVPVVDAVYDVSDSGVARQGGPRFDYSGVESVRFRTWHNRDTFRVTPSANTTFFLFAEYPGSPSPGDRLEIIPAGATGTRQVKTSATGGRFEFDNRKTVHYLGIDSFNDVVPPKPLAYTYSPAAGTYAVRYGEDLVGAFAPSDLSIRNDFTNQVTPATAVTYHAPTRTATYTVGALPLGKYTVTYAPAVVDAGGNAVPAGAPPLTVAGVVGRYVFYNNSALDGNDPAIGAGDAAAIATDKAPLRPGQAASFANVTNYTRGINGIIIDLFGGPALLSQVKFEATEVLRPGNVAAIWYTAPGGLTWDRRNGAGVGGSDRLTFVWSDGAVVDRWLRVTVPAEATATGLPAADVFAFGNLVGDTGGAGTPTVNATDLARTRANVGRTGAAALATYDFNRDGRINATDVTIVRNHQRRSLPAISMPVVAGGSVGPVMPASRSRPTERPRVRGILAEAGPELPGVG